MPFGCAKEVFTPPVLPAQSDEGSASVKNVLENRRVRSPAKTKKKTLKPSWFQGFLVVEISGIEPLTS
jgi:hypothetical protein